MEPPRDATAIDWLSDGETAPCASWANERSPLRCAYALEVLVHGDARRFALPDPEGGQVLLTLGRSRDNDVVLLDPTVSRRHALLRFVDGGWWIERAPGARAAIVAGHTPLAEGERRRIGVGAAFSLGECVLVLRASEGTRNRDAPLGPAGIVARSQAMLSLLSLCDRLAPTSIAVMILGETGTGKELVARAIHERSPRAKGPLVAINCAALPENLLEAELFGFERGAFSGAVAAKPGLFEAAHGGTLALDEIGDLALGLQAKLLRVLERGELTRLGSIRPRAVDVRIVSSTHRSLEEMVERGAFRRDLFYRIQGFALRVPSLRERVEDVELLATHFARRALGREPSFGVGVREALEAHAWPGNVRELRTVIERAALLAGGATIERVHLGLEAAQRASVYSTLPPPPALPSSAHERASLRDELRAFERSRILETLSRFDGNQSRAARHLAMPRRTLVARLSELGLTTPRAQPKLTNRD